MTTLSKLRALHAQLEACRRCPKMIRPVVHGAAVDSKVFLLGQAPGIREGPAGRPFAWTAGKTLFGWFHEAVGVDEVVIRERVYFAAVARCFPGKAKTGGGDRKQTNRAHAHACASICTPKATTSAAAAPSQMVLNSAARVYRRPSFPYPAS